MNRALTSLASPLTWLRARLVNVAERRVHGLSLVASWLANAVWLLETTWRSLVTQAYGRNAVVYSCLRLLSQSIPEARLKAYTEDKDGERKELPRDHELSLLLRHPNELMTEFEFLELTTIHLAVVGRSVWWKERDRAGHILNIWPLRPDRVGPIYAPPDSTRDGERVLWGYSYLEPGTATYLRLQRRDCIAFNFPNPDGETGGIVEGFGPLAAISREVAADNKATEHVGALLANYAQPGIALEITEPVDEDQARLIKQKFRQEFGGTQLGTPAVVDAGAKITPFGFNLRELEFPELRENVEARICAATGVPAALVGVKAGLNPTYSNAREAREFFTETTCSMYWRRYGDQLTSDLASEFGDDIIIDFDTSKVRALAGQQVEKLAPIKEGFSSGVVTVDEYRAALNLDPLPDGLGGFVRFPNVLTEVPVTPEAIKIAEQRQAEAEAKAAEQAKQQAEQQAKLAKQQGAVAKNEPEGEQNATVAKEKPPAEDDDDKPAAKFNPNHDQLGRFASGSGGGAGHGSDNLRPEGWRSPDNPIARHYQGDTYLEVEHGGHANAFGRHGYEKWANDLTPEQRDSLRAYQERQYGVINDHLRGHVEQTGDKKAAIETHVRNIDAALQDARVPYNVQTFRATDLSQPLKVGQVFTDKGYISTTISRGIAEAMAVSAGQTTLIRIRVPAGFRGAYIDQLNSKEEFELLLPRGAKFRVVGQETRRVRASTHRGAEEGTLTEYTVEAIG